MIKQLFFVSAVVLASVFVANAKEHTKAERADIQDTCTDFEAELKYLKVGNIEDIFTKRIEGLEKSKKICQKALDLFDENTSVTPAEPVKVELAAAPEEPAPALAITEPAPHVRMWDLVKMPRHKSGSRKIKIVRHQQNRQLSGVVLPLQSP